MSIKITQAIRYALDGKAMLFLGSGFSVGAKTWKGTSPITGKTLSKKLTDACGLEELPLEDAASEYQDAFGALELIKLLENEFTIKEVSSEHVAVMSLPWIRVYTTNYDLCAEIAYKEAHKDSPNEMTSVVLSSRVSENMQRPVCVHLNGSMTNLNEDTLMSEFRLTESSYVDSSLKRTGWFRQFQEDLRVSKAIIIIGYSMSFDWDIKKELSAPEIKDKAVFITAENDSPTNIHRLERYGLCSTIGTKGFADRIKNEQKYYVQSPEYYFTSFKEHTANNAVGSVTYEDMVALFFKGNLQNKFFEKDKTGEYKYLVDRTKVQDIIDEIKRSEKQVFLITGALGSGKTVFAKQLIDRIKPENWRVFTFEYYTSKTFEELNEIRRIKDKRVVLIIDGYSKCPELIESLQNAKTPNLRLILLERTSVNRTLENKIKRGFGNENIKYYNITSLDSPECKQFSYQLVQNNLDYQSEKTIEKRIKAMDEDLIKKYDGCFANTLLALFHSTDIHQRLNAEYQAMMKKKDTAQVMGIALLSATISARITLTEIMELLDLDYMKIDFQNNIFAHEIFTFREESYYLNSSIVARDILYGIQDVHILIDGLIKIIVAIDDSYKINLNYKNFLKAILSHSIYIPYLSNRDNAVEIYRFYDSVRTTPFCESDPLFWEQFASSCIDSKMFNAAESCLKTAFAKANTMENYVPYQIETVQARYIIESCLDEMNTNPLPQIDKILNQLEECHEHLFKYFDYPDNIKAYQFKVAAEYLKIWDHCHNKFGPGQMKKFVFFAKDVLDKLNKYEQAEGSNFKSEALKKALEKCLSY